MKIISIILGTTIYLNVFANLAFASDYTYTNQEQDKSGLMHYDSRYYDPDLGRFLQPDSVDVPNKYAYVSNDPVNYTDPTGNFENFSSFDMFGGNMIDNWQMDFGNIPNVSRIDSSFSDSIVGCAISICNAIENTYVSVNNSFNNWIAGGNGSDLETAQKMVSSNHQLSYEDAISLAMGGPVGKGMHGIPKQIIKDAAMSPFGG